MRVLLSYLLEQPEQRRRQGHEKARDGQCAEVASGEAQQGSHDHEAAHDTGDEDLCSKYGVSMRKRCAIDLCSKFYYIKKYIFPL